MHIESAQFPHRKVVHDSQIMRGGFGYERAQLASYVADQLNNNHKNDAAILQKFRKQAQQYKRNLLHRKHGKPIEASSQPNFIPQPNFMYPSASYTRPQIQQIRTLTAQQDNLKPQFKQQQKNKSPVIIRQIQRMSDQNSKQLIKMLQRKDKMIEKQTKIINKNQRKMSELKRRIEILQYQNKTKQNDRLMALEEDSYSKMKGFISSMSNKLLENRSLIQENFKSHRNINSNEQILQKNKSHIVESTPKNFAAKRFKRPNPQIMQNQKEPIIEYKYKVGEQNQMRQQKYGIKSTIQTLGASRNRLDTLGGYLHSNQY